MIIELPVEYFAPAVQLLDSKDVWVELVPEEVARVGRYCVIDGAPVQVARNAAQVATQKPYGDAASLLYKAGFWLVPTVLEAIGSDAEYRKWIQGQPCIACGGGDYVEETGELKCEAAHVKRPSNSGMGHKPEYSCIPLCHACHVLQHNGGLVELYKNAKRRR